MKRWPKDKIALRHRAVAHGRNLLDQVLAGRVVPAVNGVRVVDHARILPDSIPGRARGI